MCAEMLSIKTLFTAEVNVCKTFKTMCFPTTKAGRTGKLLCLYKKCSHLQEVQPAPSPPPPTQKGGPDQMALILALAMAVAMVTVVAMLVEM